MDDSPASRRTWWWLAGICVAALPPRRTLEIVRQITDALGHLHERGIVHRDLKPSNFLIRRDGSVVLTDLGLARAVEEEAGGGITRAGYTVGTVDYMPPEQAKNSRAADIRSDIYSLGCSWYHMATGKLPFPGDSLTARLAAHATQPPPDARRVHEDIPESHVAVMQRMMAKNPDDRHQTPAELLADLEQASKTRRMVGVDTLRGLADEAEEEITPPAGDAAAAPVPPDASGRTRKRRRRRPDGADDAAGRTGSDGGEDDSPSTGPEPPTGRRRRRSEGKPDADAAGDSDPRRPRRGSGGPDPRGRKGPVPPAKPGEKQAVVKGDANAKPVLDADAVRTVLVLTAAVGALGLGGWAVARFVGVFDSSPAVIGGPGNGADAEAENTAAGRRGGKQDADDDEPTGPPPLAVRDAAGPRPLSADLPAWAAAGTTADDPWAAVGRPDGRRSPTLTVGGPPGPNAARSLDAALAKLGAAGGVVRLAGPGPFVLRTAAADRPADLAVVAAGDGPRPVVTVVDDRAGEVPDPAARRVLVGLDLVANAGTGDETPLFRAARLALVDTSVTLFGDAPRTVAAASGGAATGGAATGGGDPARVLLDGVVFRGAGLRPVRLGGGSPAGEEAVLRESLFVTGGPLVSVEAPGGSAASEPGGVTKADAADATRSLWFDGVAAVLGGPAVTAGADATLVVRDSHLGTVSGGTVSRGTAAGGTVSGGTAAGGTVSGGTAAGGTVSGGTAAGGTGSGGTAAAGIPLLAGSGSADGFEPTVRVSVADTRLSGFAVLEDGVAAKPGRSGEPGLSPAAWPARLLEDAAAADPRAVASASAPAPRGADRWAVPAASGLERAVAWADRPGDVPPFPAGGPEVAVDLDRQGLGEVVAAAADGARLTVRGSGPTDLPPVYVRGKAVQLTFEDGERPLELRAGASTLEPGEAAFTVADGGRLRLVGGRFEFDRQRPGSPAGPLVEVRDGTAELVRGEVRGTLNGPPLLAATPNAGGRLAVDRSLLTTPAAAVSVGAGSRVSVTGSLLVSPDAAVDLSGGSLLLEGSTLSAGEAFLRTGSGGGTSPGGAGTGGDRAAAFVERTVFAPPPRGSRTADTDGRTPLLAGPAPRWWGTGNAYAGTVSLGGGVARDVAPFDAAFGRGHERNSTFGPAAVVLAERDPPRWSQTKPEAFALTGGDAASADAPPGIDPAAVGPAAADADGRTRSQPDRPRVIGPGF